MVQEFYSNGKLLITGEYAVLDGAQALAIPTKFGQSLSVKKIEKPELVWKSYNADGTLWFEAVLTVPGLKISNTNDIRVAKTLKSILEHARKANPGLLTTDDSFFVETKLNFDRNWGLGTSSTLISNIANWANVDPYHLLSKTFGGSGYDIACAGAKTPLVFSLDKGKAVIAPTTFYPAFADCLFFVYLNKKQDSREAIKNYRMQSVNKNQLTTEISKLTEAILDAKTLGEFETLLLKHEQLLSEVLRLTRLQEILFPDFNGVIKSLGGWGGDFVLATGNEKTPDFFKAKGFQTVIPFEQMLF